MEPSDQRIQEIKTCLEASHGREFSWEEAAKAARDMQTLADIAVSKFLEEMRRKEMLTTSPKGFHLDDSGSCQICGLSTSNENSWYDKYGLKCVICQKAVNEKIIPSTIIKNDKSWYSKYELESYFNLRGALLNRYIKEGILRARTVLNEKKKVHLLLFLISDNKDVLPPKKLLKSRLAKVMLHGEEYLTHEPWYEFMDAKLLKRLSKYKILQYLHETFAQPIKSGRFLFKSINPLFTYKG